MRHGLVDTDRSPELLPRLCMLDAELERRAGDSGRLQCERSELLVLRGRRIEELVAAIRTPCLFEHHCTIEKGELVQLIPSPTAVRGHFTRFATQQVLLFGEGELHQRDLGRPSTRSAMMLRRISLVPASI